MVPSLRLVALLPILGLIQQIEVAAQIIVDPICTEALWTFNHKGQSPCLVAATLMGTCYSGSFHFYPLPPPYTGWSYRGPDVAQSNLCWCSTVTYAMNAACGYCQGGTWDSWPYWNYNCSRSDITMDSFPLIFTTDISVPLWAYLDPTASAAGNSWSADLAQALIASSDVPGGSQPTTFASLLPSTVSSITSTLFTSVSHPSITVSIPTPSTASTSTSTTSTIATSPSPVISSSQPADRSSRTVGIAVGAAVGCGMVAIAGGIFFFFMLYRRNKTAAPINNGNPGGETTGPISPISTPYILSEESQRTLTHSYGMPKPYDPRDPSTFFTGTGPFSGPQSVGVPGYYAGHPQV